ncbi:hypothetical protein FRUB_04699 [Fimbriiglobus ruber]|uniref:Uncharacterized protein n=1 Tax=Fimbriiglobus ruber TaxID=1908690 RepID=A0A225DXG4_9BACT|nr:hypothetical protein FRUB_04699 [Fimbriiglobus ruber]
MEAGSPAWSRSHPGRVTRTPSTIRAIAGHMPNECWRPPVKAR